MQTGDSLGVEGCTQKPFINSEVKSMNGEQIKSNLTATIEKTCKPISSKAIGAIEQLSNIAADLGMQEAIIHLEEVKNSLKDDNFHLIIVGRFKVGKSTLMNALLGPPSRTIPELAKGRGPMPTDTLPTTATLTNIRYSEKPYVKVLHLDGTYEHWSVEKYLKESIVREDIEETKIFFQNIREFELGYPTDLCKAGITLIDSPGIADEAYRTEIAKQAVQKCDAAIMLYRSDNLAGMDERDFALTELMGKGIETFTIVNLHHMQLNERVKGFSWNRLVKELQNGPKYDGQDFASRNIYFVDAHKAEQGKFNADGELVKEFGLAQFEQVLGDFLAKEKYRVHIERFTQDADHFAEGIANKIAEQLSSLKQDKTKLETAYEASKPKFEQIRIRRDKLPKIFDWYQKVCQQEMETSFKQMIAELRGKLSDELHSRKLTSLEEVGIGAVFKMKQSSEEAQKIYLKIIDKKILTWNNNSAQKILEKNLQGLTNEICLEIAKIETNINDIKFQITGFKPQIDTLVLTLQEMILRITLAVFFGGTLPGLI